MKLSEWLHHGEKYHTTQISAVDGKITRIWEPGLRQVDLSRATYARFDGSRRDYAGLTHIMHTNTQYVAYDKDLATWIIYTLLTI